MKNKKADFLEENIVFIIIAILFIVMLFLFISKSGSSTYLAEQASAKKLALMLDSARPGTNIKLNIDDILEKKADSIAKENIVNIIGNTVTVKLSEKSGYSYNFFTKRDIKSQIIEDAEGNFLVLAIN